MSNVADDILVRRYEYVLARKKEVNEVPFKIAAFYQTAGAALVACQFIVLDKWQAGTLKSQIALMGTKGILALLAVISAGCIMMLLAGVASWIDYRKEEREIEGSLGLPDRGAVNINRFWRWYETYIVAGIGALTIIYAAYVSRVIFPLLGA